MIFCVFQLSISPDRIHCRNVLVVNMSVSVVNLLTSLYGILRKKNAQKRFFTAVCIHIHKVAINLLVNELQRLLCKNKCLLDSWLMAAAGC